MALLYDARLAPTDWNLLNCCTEVVTYLSRYGNVSKAAHAYLCVLEKCVNLIGEFFSMDQTAMLSQITKIT